jgi:hypothetical protein
MFQLNRGLMRLKSAKRFPFAVWDVEASDWWNLQLIGFFDGERYVHFRAVGDFLDYVLQEKYQSYRMFAHFGGRYDMNFVFDYLRKAKPHLNISFYCSGSMVVSMTLHDREHVIRLCDSYRLLPGGLRDLGIAFDVPHKKTTIDYKNIEYGPELIDYNEQDCRCLYEVIQTFFAISGDLYSETFATHALSTFRRDFLKATLFKPPAEVDAVTRAAYHGGRVEVFKRKADKLTAYDVNSMYPYVMLKPMPVEYTGRKRNLLEADNLYGFVDATVWMPETYAPLLPVRIEGSGRLFFPTGKFRRIWTAEELIVAETQGLRILKIHHGYYFHAEEIFAEYVERFYTLKRTATEPMRTIAKLLLNSLYGKFGQKPARKMFFSDEDAPELAYPLISQSTGLPTGFSEYIRESHGSHLLPHIATAVTAKARLHLSTQLTDAVYYCDTDSVFTTHKIEPSKEIGGWGLIGEGEAEFYQPKLYKFRGTWKAKGLTHCVKRGEHPPACECGAYMIDGYVKGSPNKIVRSRSIKEALRGDVPACAHVEVEKVMNDLKPKRCWIVNDTRPWDIGEL